MARRNLEACGLAGGADIVLATGEGLEGPSTCRLEPALYRDRRSRASSARSATSTRARARRRTDGLDAYRAIVPGSSLLARGGRLFLEVGAGQAGDVLAIAASLGLVGGETRRDLAGIERVVIGSRPE